VDELNDEESATRAATKNDVAEDEQTACAADHRDLMAGRPEQLTELTLGKQEAPGWAERAHGDK
jgi:hypothetical protein